jgi:hypothetical protein
VQDPKKKAVILLSIGIIGGLVIAIWYGSHSTQELCGTFAEGTPSTTSKIFEVGCIWVFAFIGLGSFFAIKKPVARLLLSLVLGTGGAIAMWLILAAIGGRCFSI